MTYSNLFYFRVISKIGGTEQFLYEMAKKYHKKDITILYDFADIDQLIRLKKLVRCVKRERGATYKAIRAFYNFNLDAMPQVEADEHIFICHAIYQQLDFAPPLTNPKLTRFIGVSEYACRELERYGEYQGRKIKAELCYNPLTLEKTRQVVKLISACRLDDKVKGGDRTLRLIEALDDYCERTGRNYLWTIFTNTPKIAVESPNVVIMKPRIDIRPYIADSDWLVQLSNDMESYCYSINEALSYGTKVVRTPLSVAPELRIPPNMNLVCKWDMSNAEDVAEELFEKTDAEWIRDYQGYEAPKDGWHKLLVNKPSTYTPKVEKVRVQAIKSFYDLERNTQVYNYSQSWECSLERARKLVKLNLVRLV